MEPQLPPTGPTPERGPVVNREQAPSLDVPNMPEVAPVQSPERAGSIERSSGDTRGIPAPMAASPVAAPPVPVIQPIPVAKDNAVTSSNPATAADDDLIEKEWVTKAKQVVQATHDDPHEQEKQVGKLVADYVLKRYGKEVGKNQDQEL